MEISWSYKVNIVASVYSDNPRFNSGELKNKSIVAFDCICDSLGGLIIGYLFIS